MLASPWKTIARLGNASQVAQAIASELAALERRDEAVGVIVLGYPRRLSGEVTGQTAAVEKVADHLRRIAGVPLVLQDERLSSHEADGLLARREKNWRKRKERLDAMAAAVILQDYLDSASARGADPSEEESDR